MKTLDEVIETVPYVGTEWTNDALHYLQEYRETKKHLACLDDAEIRGDNTQVVNNPPLSWNELKQMEGKPVWVEIWEATDSDFVQYRWGNGAWYIVKDFVSGALAEYCHLTPNRRTWIKQSYGEEWQAYRKEREK